MRHLAVSILLAALVVASSARAEDFSWPGRGTIRLAVPAGWSVASKDVGEVGYAFKAQPRSGPPLVVRITLAWLPSNSPMNAGTVKANLEEMVQPYLSGSVEKTFDPKPLPVTEGTGWFVQLTDASLVGKPPKAGDSKAMRNALALLGGRVAMIATIQLDDPALPALSEAMALVSSVRVEPGKDGQERQATGTAFEFTIPQSRVIVRVPEMGLRPDDDESPGPNYFKLSKSEPQLILSGWLEPASRYEGLEAFWKNEKRSPAYAGALAPRRVETIQVGPWEVVAFDVPVGGGTSAHLRAERVLAGTWIDLHLSTTSARAATVLRAELVGALGKIEVVEKRGP